MKYDEHISRNIKIDIRPKIKVAHGMEMTMGDIELKKINLKKYCDLFNWDRIYLKMLNFKMNNDYYNLRIQKEVLPEIIKNDEYEVYAEQSQIRTETFTDINNLENILFIVLKSYIERYYRCISRKKETEQLQLFPMVEEEDNLRYDHYTLKIEIPKDKEEREQRKKRLKR